MGFCRVLHVVLQLYEMDESVLRDIHMRLSALCRKASSLAARLPHPNVNNDTHRADDHVIGSAYDLVAELGAVRDMVTVTLPGLVAPLRSGGTTGATYQRVL